MNVITVDMAARGGRERAVALWDEFVTPNVPAEYADRNAAWKELLKNPESKALDAMDVDPVAVNIESGIAFSGFDRMLDQAEHARKQAGDVQLWWMPSAWLPSTLALRKDPRFFAIAEDLGMVRMWGRAAIRALARASRPRAATIWVAERQANETARNRGMLLRPVGFPSVWSFKTIGGKRVSQVPRRVLNTSGAP